MTAFSEAAGRSTRLSGTRAELTGDGQTIRIYDFLSRAERLITPSPAGAMNAATRHGGGDAGLPRNERVRTAPRNNPARGASRCIIVNRRVITPVRPAQSPDPEFRHRQRRGR
jgi:hypothetical protein